MSNPILSALTQQLDKPQSHLLLEFGVGREVGGGSSMGDTHLSVMEGKCRPLSPGTS